MALGFRPFFLQDFLHERRVGIALSAVFFTPAQKSQCLIFQERLSESAGTSAACLPLHGSQGPHVPHR
jgi:hypothetical protein